MRYNLHQCEANFFVHVCGENVNIFGIFYATYFNFFLNLCVLRCVIFVLLYVSFFCITMLTVILCTFLIDSNVSLINGKTFFGKFCKLCPMSCRIDKTQIVFNVLLILVFTIGIYISNTNRNKKNNSYEVNGNI